MPSYHRNINTMVKRISLVWKRPELSDMEFRRLWLGEHVIHAKRLPGLREYVIDFATERRPGAPDGIATVRFDSRQALDSAFADAVLSAELVRTRETFARAVQVLIVDEEEVVPLSDSEAS